MLSVIHMGPIFERLYFIRMSCHAKKVHSS